MSKVKYLAKQEKSCDAKLEDLRMIIYGSQLHLIILMMVVYKVGFYQIKN